jgi:ubiquinone/menaquinone biosynthesis C-methylase UbiE
MTEWNDQTAEWYAENYGEYPANIAALEGLDFNPNLVIVDVGCGTGSALRAASDKYLGGKLIGIDPVNRMVEIARERIIEHPEADRISFQKGSAENLPLGDNFSDFVLAFDSIDHWNDTKKGISEIKRVLKDNGKLVIVKDLEVPDAANKLADLREGLCLSGFSIYEDQEIFFEKVRFVRMICGKIDNTQE